MNPRQQVSFSRNSWRSEGILKRYTQNTSDCYRNVCQCSTSRHTVIWSKDACRSNFSSGKTGCCQMYFHAASYSHKNLIPFINLSTVHFNLRNNPHFSGGGGGGVVGQSCRLALALVLKSCRQEQTDRGKEARTHFYIFSINNSPRRVCLQ